MTDIKYFIVIMQSFSLIPYTSANFPQFSPIHIEGIPSLGLIQGNGSCDKFVADTHCSVPGSFDVVAHIANAGIRE